MEQCWHTAKLTIRNRHHWCLIKIPKFPLKMLWQCPSAKYRPFDLGLNVIYESSTSCNLQNKLKPVLSKTRKRCRSRQQISLTSESRNTIYANPICNREIQSCQTWEQSSRHLLSNHVHINFTASGGWRVAGGGLHGWLRHETIIPCRHGGYS